MSDFLFYTLAFLVLLGALVFVHELGHFTIARLAGVKVLRFALGFGRPLFLWRAGKDATEWAVCIVPLGGYVRMLGEGDEDEVDPREAHRSFSHQSVWKRMAIVAAGPLANFLMATAIYWGLFLHGAEELRPLLGKPVAASPAEAAGIQNGDRVLRVDGNAIETWTDLRWFLLRQMMEKETAELEILDTRGQIVFRSLFLAQALNPEPGEDPLGALGLTLFRPLVPAVLGKVMPGGAAAAAGLLPGDMLLRISGQEIVSWGDVVRKVSASPEVSLLFEYRRDGALARTEVTPAREKIEGHEIGRIGVMAADPGIQRDALFVTVRYAVLPALGKAMEETWDKSIFSLRAMGRMLAGVLSWRNLSGPVTIADLAGQTASLGLEHYLRFMALVSLSLAVLNLLPVPVLDGGYLLYYVAEIVRGKPLSDRWMMLGQKIGLTLVAALMVLALYNDLTRLIPGNP